MAFEKLDFTSRSTGSSTEPCLHVTPNTSSFNSAFVREANIPKGENFYVDIMFDAETGRFAIILSDEKQGGKICKPSDKRSHVPLHLKGVFASVGKYIIKKEVIKLEYKKKIGGWVFELDESSYTSDMNAYNKFKAERKAKKNGTFVRELKDKKKKKIKNR